jgi:acyl-coenzyme A synthetase/AMP-(fatty) acid ligase
MVVDRIYEWARLQPHKTALIHNDVRLSYAEYASRIGAARAFLEAYDLPVGAIGLLIIPDAAEAWVYLLALRLLGLTTACASAGDSGLGYLERDVACIVTTRDYVGRNPRPAGTSTNAKVIVVPERTPELSAIVNVPQSPSHSPPFGGHVLLTSGTTGSYKKVLMPGAHEDRRNAARAKTKRVDRNTVFNAVDYPMWAGAGFKDPSALWHVGATVIIDDRLGRLARLFDYNPTRIFLTPAHLNVALERAKRSQADVDSGSSTLSISSGQASVGAMRRALETLSTSIVINWSATELIAFPMTSQVRETDDMVWLEIHDDRIVEIVDESGAVCPAGAEGAMRIQLSDIEQPSYLDDTEATERHFRDGYFYPGDLAVRRADGRVRILGRANDVLNIRGHKVAAAPLEQEVQDMLGVDGVCLFGGVNDEGFDELVIAIESDREPPRIEQDRVAKKFEKFERIRFELVKEFPRTQSGMQKIKRAELRQLVFRNAERRD